MHFSLGLKITDIDDYHEIDTKIVTPGGLIHEFMMAVENFNT